MPEKATRQANPRGQQAAAAVRWTPEVAAAWELLSPRIERLARRFSCWARRGGHGKDDLTQSAAVAFPRWVSRYDPSRGISLRSFVSVCCARLFIQLGRVAPVETKDLHEVTDGTDGRRPMMSSAALVAMR